MLKRRQNEVKRNIFLFDEVKKHSRKSPEIQFKELNDKLRSSLSNQQIYWTMPAKTQTILSQKIEKLKQSNKLNKIYSLLKLLKLLNLRQNFFPLKIPISKKCSKPICISEMGPVLYLQDLKKKINGPWRLINSKMTKKLKKKEINSKV